MVDSQDQKVQTKDYFYNQYSDLDISSATLSGKPSYKSTSGNIKSCSNRFNKYCYYIFFHSPSRNSAGYAETNKSHYLIVTKNADEIFEGGGIEHFYNIALDKEATTHRGNPVISFQKTANRRRNRTMCQESCFKIKRNARVTTKNIDYYYREDPSKYFRQKGLVVIKKWENSIAVPNSITLTPKDLDKFVCTGCTKAHNYWLISTLNSHSYFHGNEVKVCRWDGPSAREVINSLNSPDNYNISDYQLISGFDKLNYTIATKFDENGQNEVSKRIDNLYESLYHSLLTRGSTTDGNGRQYVRKYKYPVYIVIQDNESCNITKNSYYIADYWYNIHYQYFAMQSLHLNYLTYHLPN